MARRTPRKKNGPLALAETDEALLVLALKPARGRAARVRLAEIWNARHAKEQP